MKKVIAGIMLIGSVVWAPSAQASPAMCDNHNENSDMSSGYAVAGGDDTTYVTACGGDSGPDAGVFHATAPHIGWGDNG
jgi:hypothetical protein